jgi:hypothetical protein
LPTDATADSPYTPDTRTSRTLATRFYSNNTINFFAAGGSCNNTWFSTVIAHEQGHGLNVRYGTNNGSDGMGEGNADVFALYAFDTPLNGQGFFTNGGAVRTGNNTRQFCGDCSPSCYGEVHSDGEPWMGAAWKVRVNLNNSLGNTAGDQTADLIFLSWMNAFNQREIRSIIELQWLILDDHDANLTNGTPPRRRHQERLPRAGFPGYEIEFISTTTRSGAVVRGELLCRSTPRFARCQTTSITGVAITWRVNGGAWNTNAMTPTGGDKLVRRDPVRRLARERRVQDHGHGFGREHEGRVLRLARVLHRTAPDVRDGRLREQRCVDDRIGRRHVEQQQRLGSRRSGRKSGTSQAVPWADPAVARIGHRLSAGTTSD